jgi:hypothetical protein
MAWAVDDKDQYLFGSYIFARELVHHYVKQRGGKYFYEHQPYNQFEAMPAHIYPTDLWGGTRGWQVDGPTWGHLESGEHQSANRWFRFHDPDVGRFYRDHLKEDVRSELDWYARAGEEGEQNVFRLSSYQEWTRRDQPHMLNSLVRLKSFLLGDPYEKLSDQSISNFQTGWGAADIAVGYAYLRSMVPVRWKRLGPEEVGPSPFVLGLQRRGLEDRITTVQAIWREGLQIEPRWLGWFMPAGPAEDEGHRSFGTIRGDFSSEVPAAQGIHWISNGCAAIWADSEGSRASSLSETRSQDPLVEPAEPVAELNQGR